MVGLILSRTSSIVGKSVRDLADVSEKYSYVPIAIQRSGTQYTIIPRGDTQFREGDQVYFVTVKEGLESIYTMVGKVKEDLKNVMILGGSNIGFKTARDLCASKFKVKLIEANKDKAFEIADDVPSCLVINGDGRNVELLEEEAISDMDAFVSVTGNSETNIMSCLVAKSRGVKKTIALVENMDYFQLSQSIGINTLINKKLLAANTIFRYIRKGEVVAITKLNNMNVELLEFIVHTDSAVCNKVIRELDFPRSAIIGGIIRDGQGIIALGDFEIKEGDRVVVCCLPQALEKVEKLFV